jgi:hypothetical protein
MYPVLVAKVFGPEFAAVWPIFRVSAAVFSRVRLWLRSRARLQIPSFGAVAAESSSAALSASQRASQGRLQCIVAHFHGTSYCPSVVHLSAVLLKYINEQQAFGVLDRLLADAGEVWMCRSPHDEQSFRDAALVSSLIDAWP